MPVPPPDNPLVCKVTLVYNRDTRKFLNSFHVDKPTPWTLPEMVQLAIDFRDWWDQFLSNPLPGEVALSQVQVRKYDPTAPLGMDLDVSPPIAGGDAGPAAPGNATQTISWRTGLAGRRFRGRNYVPGLGEGQISTSDLVSSTVVNALAAAAGELILGALTSGKLTIFHAPQEVPTPYDNTTTDVISAVIENVVDSQRRRLPGRGR